MADERDRQESGENDDRQSNAEERRQPSQASGQPIGGNDSNTGSGTTLTQGAEFGADGKQGEGFMAQQDPGSDDAPQDREGASDSSSANASGGSDFADQGRGALDQGSTTASEANRDESDAEGQDDSGSF